MKNKDNIWHLVWIIGIFVVLISILILVIEYKVKWEDKDLNTYLYFYNCSGQLCTTNEKVTDYYSKVKCNNKTCPYIKEKQDNLVILATDTKEYVFDYQNDKIINEYYNKYAFANDYLIVKTEENKYGIIDVSGTVLVTPEYNKIVDYKDGYLAYSENGKIGIVNASENVNIAPAYEDVKFINSSKYVYLEEGRYYIAAYDTELPVNNFTYEYVYPIQDIILIIKDKKLDILNPNLESNLLLKLDTYYEYEVEKERATLNIYVENNLLHFSIYDPNGTTNYIYDIKNKKLFK